MTKIYLIRHARSIANDTNVLCGITDCGLSKAGYVQVQKLTEYFKKIQVDYFYSSPLTRAIETIRPIATNQKKPIVTRAQLREMNYGDYEGMSMEKMKFYDPRAYHMIEQDGYHWGIPNQEDALLVGKRMEEEIFSIAKKHQNDTVVIASHFEAITLFLCRILGIALEDANSIPEIQNTSITILNYDGEFTIEKIGITPHLEF